MAAGLHPPLDDQDASGVVPTI
eukprot:SAG22_NODE_17002_length_313_cov_0.855140_1_plen_21_part_10